LPSEFEWRLVIFIDPPGRVRFQQLNRGRDRELWVDLDQQMGVIFNAARMKQRRLVISDGATDLGKQVVSPIVMEDGFAVFGEEDHVQSVAVVRRHQASPEIEWDRYADVSAHPSRRDVV
jgi:phosphoenolpyruvate synthase/pyruvate phosphate dikinase